MMSNNYSQMMNKHRMQKKVVNQKDKEKQKHLINSGKIIIKILNQVLFKIKPIVKNQQY